jgi:hypothetical protein
MTSKSVLKRIMALLSTEEVALTDARDSQGQILQSPTFDLGEPVEVVSEDGTKSPAPDGEHEISLKDSEGNEVIIRVVTKDGKITERENVEEMADVKTQPIPQGTGEELPENERPEQPNSVKSGTLKAGKVDEKTVSKANESETAKTTGGAIKMQEQDEEAMPIPATEDKSMEEEGENPEISIELGKKMEEMAYSIEEMGKKIAALEAMFPPVASQVIQEAEGIKMSAEPDEEEELPKLDGAPVDETPAYKFSAENKKTYGKKVKNSQSNFLSKLYN